ncbi:MAG: cyclic nucleotide-binding domain-containing protein [Alphaproteobacteria bacterium]|nr:cyclic nucleotide-binding domain-containing protein [Alphaproteobacteria bacterium]
MTKFELLSFLPPEEQAAKLDGLDKLTFDDNEVIFTHGDNSTDVYFILEGATKSVNYGPDGGIAYFRLRKAGDFFGYYAAISGGHRTATMMAVGKTHLAKMNGAAFMLMVTTCPGMSRYMLQLVTGLLREETNRITGMVVLNAQQLVCAELVSESESQKKERISILSRQEMAAKLGLTRETISRVLAGLAKKGIISLHKDTVEIKDKSELLAISTGASIL